jgi:tRNA-binding EMAP/Myf-like protein
MAFAAAPRAAAALLARARRATTTLPLRVAGVIGTPVIARRRACVGAADGEGAAAPAAVAATLPAAATPAEDAPAVTKLDIRVGRVLEVAVHPDADG